MTPNEDKSIIFSIGVLIGIIFGMMIGAAVMKNLYHEPYCVERFYRAETAADTLAVVLSDEWCVRLIK